MLINKINSSDENKKLISNNNINDLLHSDELNIVPKTGAWNLKNNITYSFSMLGAILFIIPIINNWLERKPTMS